MIKLHVIVILILPLFIYSCSNHHWREPMDESQTNSKNQFLRNKNTDLPFFYLNFLEQKKDSILHKYIVACLPQVKYMCNDIDTIIVFNILLDSSDNYIKWNREMYYPKINDTLVLYTFENRPVRIIVNRIDFCDSISKSLKHINNYQNLLLLCDISPLVAYCKIIDKCLLVDINKDSLLGVVFRYNFNNRFRIIKNTLSDTTTYYEDDSIAIVLKTSKMLDLKRNLTYQINNIIRFMIGDTQYIIIGADDNKISHYSVDVLYKVVRKNQLIFINYFGID